MSNLGTRRLTQALHGRCPGRKGREWARPSFNWANSKKAFLGGGRWGRSFLIPTRVDPGSSLLSSSGHCGVRSYGLKLQEPCHCQLEGKARPWCGEARDEGSTDRQRHSLRMKPAQGPPPFVCMWCVSQQTSFCLNHLEVSFLCQWDIEVECQWDGIQGSYLG